uniref:ARM repeat-containing protein n=1 Tax=Mycena chlorophos TaxID=658473 RepID=A0ABQ0M222_MYCCL|nr:ARM repeat-containing protein [Mycena chlorophos]
MHIILTGATGLVGGQALRTCLANPSVTKLSILSRREFALPTEEGLDTEKAVIIVHKDYDTYPPALLEQLQGAHGCIWAQGISQTKVSRADYLRITYDFPMAAAKAFGGLAEKFNFVYVSGEGADPEEKSSILFAKTKGKTEKDLRALPSEYPALRIFNVRPGYVRPSPAQRPELSFSGRLLHGTVGSVMSAAMPSRVSPSDVLAKVLVELATGKGEPLEPGVGVEDEVNDAIMIINTRESVTRRPSCALPPRRRVNIMASELASVLKATLDPNPNTRIAAELKLTQLLALPDAGLALSSLVHSASIILRKYVTERWSPYFPAFKGSPPSPETKSQIRAAVFQGLSDPDRKIRTLCAHTLSAVASSDWPDEYPDLLSSLIGLISSGSPNSVHGAMQVFTEFIKSDLTEDQILPVLRDLLPVLLNILGAPEVHTALTRARTVSVFNQCVTSLYMVKGQHPQAVKEAIATILPIWLEAFKVLLSTDPQQDIVNRPNWDGLAVRIQVFKALDTINTSFPRALTPYLSVFLTAALNHLTALFPTFSQYYLASNESAPTSSENESIELPQLICPIFDFMGAVTRGGRYKSWFEEGNSNLSGLIAAVFNFLQMTHEDEETWATNPNAFVAQEDDETQQYSVRVAGFDLLASLIDQTRTHTANVFQTTIQDIISASQQAREAGSSAWWKPLEAGLAAIGSQAEAVEECVEDEQNAGRPKPIDIELLLSNVVPSVLALTEFPFLQGRGFVFASQYAKLLPVQLAGQYIEAAIQVIEASEAGVPVKISAVRAVHNFFQSANEGPTLSPFAPRIAKDLGPFLLVTSDDTLSLVLETLSVIIAVDKGRWITPELASSLTLSVIIAVDKGRWITPELASSLVTAILEVWTSNNKDPIFLSNVDNILTSLASSEAEGIYQTVVKQALPSLCRAMTDAPLNESYITASAIQLVSSLVAGAQEGALGDGFFAVLAPSLFKSLGEAEDRDVIQNGISCLTLVIRKDCPQLLAWSDASTGKSGIDGVLALIAKLLESQDESGGLVIGDLIIHLLRRAGESVLPVLPQLLQAMIARMRTAKTATFTQSLVVPFAFLINNQRDTVLDLLDGMNVDGRPALDILIQTWCENAETFQGFWPTRVSTLALCQLFVSERPSLQALVVKGDIIVKPETQNVIMTRSRTKTTPHQFSSISFPLKALKLILHDVQAGGESATVTAQGETFAPDVDSDDGDEDWADEDNVTKGKDDEFAYLSDLIGPRGMAFDNDDALDEDDDEDLQKDPISTMDLQAHLHGFFRECAARNTSGFSGLVDQMSAEETLVIQRVVNVNA